VLRRGRRVENRQTGVAVELPGTRIAMIEATGSVGSNYLDELSACRVVEGAIPGESLSDLIVEQVR